MQFGYDWKLFLAKHNVPHFHMKEFAHSVGAFTTWKGKEGTRRGFMRGAAGIIVDTIQRGFFCCVSDQIFEDFGKKYELRNYFSSPYALAGRTCANLVVEWASTPTSFPRNDIEYVFEDGADDKGGLIDAMKLKPRLADSIFLPGKDQKPTKKCPNGRQGTVQLQAADYLAYEISKFTREHQNIKADPSKFRASLGILPEKKVKRMFFTEQKMEILCSMIGIPRRP